ncbi:hypothetical protein [Oceanobacter mangrovi]|uniref:hypothetical protein n=1 Tax=Oceanobacter mangrovi TaxID=2862510 RepID=UPI001C8D3C36|nr:hypothetical protein [Oceanobacter mangrovi]
MNAEFLTKYGYDLSDDTSTIPARQIEQVSDMRIKCPSCQKAMTVYSRASVTDTVNTVYARCQNHECDHAGESATFDICFGHWISAKAAAAQMTLSHLFDQLPADERRALVADLSARV